MGNEQSNSKAKVNKSSRFKNSDGTHQISRIEQLFPYEYNHKKKKWLKSKFGAQTVQSMDNKEESKHENKQNETEAHPLIVMSFNIWFGNENWDQRQMELVKILKEIEPNVFCFQEITAKWLITFTQIPFIQNNYILTAIPEDVSSIGGYGVFIGIQRNKLNVLDVKNCRLQSSMGRMMLSMKVMVTNTGEIIWINTVHLESKNAMNIRIRQLEIIFDEYISKMGQNESMLMGDFNFRDNNDTEKFKENDYLKEGEFVDCWKAFSAKNNIQITDGWTRRIGYRYDRILLKSNRWNVVDFKIIGDADKRMPSDHKGVVVYLK